MSSSRSRLRIAFLTSLLAATALLGCGPRKTEEPAPVSKKPAVDKLRTINDDLLHGHLEEQRFAISSPLLPRVEFDRSEVRELSFGKKEDTLRTRRGDMLRGRIEPRRFRFRADVGVAKEFRSSDLKRIQLGG